MNDFKSDRGSKFFSNLRMVQKEDGSASDRGSKSKNKLKYENESKSKIQI